MHTIGYHEGMKINEVAFYVQICKLSKMYLKDYTKTGNIDCAERKWVNKVHKRGRIFII